MDNFNAGNGDIDIAIIGAGIGGASAAVALQQAGFRVDVFEQASQLREVGGGIVIREPSMVLLSQWGVLDDLKRKLVKVNKVEIRDSAGAVLGIAPTAVEEGEPDYAYSVHRADLHDALVSKLPASRLHLGHRVRSIENLAGYALADFENGRRIKARLIVGADGLRSVARTLLDQTPMTFLGLVVHRTIAPAALLPVDMPNDRIRTWQAGKLGVNLLPIRGGAEIAISAAIRAQTAPEILWGATSADALLSAYADFDPLIIRLIEARTTGITTHPVYDKEPTQRWTDRHVALLGDAAHPMAPMNGQGANQAIQDAYALTAAMGGHRDDLKSALAEYQSVRAPIAARIQLLSRKPPPSLSRFVTVAG